ncbi:glycerol acyltransferase [Lyngbya confervoides]|uniref:Glycerol acyltransferase n=1 Tax=Lyngbya confervoides BDU141951 TaxID=1574623 RepID=A0ABD4T8H1_9CYAN|nr:glycerol acyltransferase [Lyngbya confervoides]MCM1984881.1 glycerol acyltransferase [Lyngbya confervoides BDU141951]
MMVQQAGPCPCLHFSRDIPQGLFSLMIQSALSLPWSSLQSSLKRPRQLFQSAIHCPEDRWDGTRLSDRDPTVIEGFLPLWQWFHDHYFQVTMEGWDYLPQPPYLVVGSHNGGLAAPDMFLFMLGWFRRCGPESLAYGLMNPKMWVAYPPLARLAAQAGALRATPRLAIAALQAQAAVLVYPGGARDVFRPYRLRHQIYLNGNTAFIKLALRERVPIVPLISWGAHATLRVIADLYPQLQKLHQRGMPWLLGIDPEVWPLYVGWPFGLGFGPVPNIPFPGPIHIRIGAPLMFERQGPAAARDEDYVYRCYDQVHQHMQAELNDLVQIHRTPQRSARS